MAINFDADLAHMLGDDFGVVVTVRGQSLQAIYNNGYAEALGVDGSAPNLECRTSDVERLTIVKGDMIDGLPKPWRVSNIEDDGTGMSKIMLRT